MTIDISNNDPRISYSVAQGVTQTSFAVPFEFFDDSDVNVYVDGTLKTITTDYTISGGGGSTGTVTISVTGATGGSVVVLTRDITIERTTDFTAGADINRAALNTQLDTLTAIAADVKDRAGLALSYNDRTVGVPTELPDVDNLKGRYLAFNLSTGAPEAGATVQDVNALANISADIGLLADIEDGTIATGAITTVSGISSNVTTVSNISSSVSTVAGNTTNINTVATDLVGDNDIGTVAGSIANVNTTANNISNVNLVAGISANVTAVAADATDIGTVASNIADVNTVAGISSDVTAVVADATDIGTVAADLAGSDTIGTVAGNIANVNTVAGIDADVTAVAGDATDIGTVATNITNVNTVAGISSDVTTVAGITSDIAAVVADEADIGTVATNIADVNTVAGISANVTTVAGISADVTSVAADATDIGTVATNISNVNTVAGNTTNINTVAGISSDVTTVAGISADVVAAPTFAADAESARDQAQAARDTANLHKLAAEAAATSATNTASSLTGFDLAAIAETKAVTAVDVFVYDTSKDSDGGAWRKRTQNTSWYQETLNTATRGARREFPAVAVIVAEANKVTIYDGDDPALPMWMVFNGGSFRPVFTSGMSSVSALNGIVSTGASVLFGRISFIADLWTVYRAEAAGSNFGIANRNATFTAYSQPNTAQIVNNAVNDVAMTVLPDAPIDPATGLPVPTIVVATGFGTSVITDSGAVYDSLSTAAPASVNFVDQATLAYGFNDFTVVRFQDISKVAADGWEGFGISPGTVPAVLAGNGKVAVSNAVANLTGLSFLDRNPATLASSMIAYTTSTYNTGWMNGDIKGAFLSDTDDTDLVGLELYQSDWSVDTDGWSPSTNVTLSVSGGELTLTNGTPYGQGAAGRAVHSFTTVVGQTYVVRATKSGGSVVGLVGVSSVETSTNRELGEASVSTGDIVITFVASATTTWLKLMSNSIADGATSTWSNLTLELADADRSVNNKGLIVNGTVTRTPVATGADLVAYSGFSASNYLEQPYNSDLDFGTGDFCVMGWVKATSFPASQVLLERQEPARSNSARFGAVLQTGRNVAFFAGSSAYMFSNPISANVWSFFVGVVRGGVFETYIDGRYGFATLNSFPNTVTNTSAITTIGVGSDGTSIPATECSLALWRISATAPTADQIKKIYEDEKFLFQDGAQATLFGASDAVTALAHDPVTDLLHVGTSAGRSVFQGLRRVSNTTTAVGTAISASNGLVVEE